MRNRYGVFSCCVLLSFVVVLDDAYAKKPQESADVSAIYLDVLLVKACAVGKGCSTVGGPKQINLLEMAEGKTDFAKQVLMPAKTNELRLILGKNSTIAVDGQTYPLTVPSGQVSGLKLKGQKVFSKTSGFLAGITLDFDLAKGVLVKTKTVKGKGKKDKDTVVYSYSLKPVVKVISADIEPLKDGEAAVIAIPGKESTITIGDNFSLFIPAGAVSAPMVISAEETKYTVEVLDEATGEVVKKPALSSKYELSPDGAEFNKPLVITIPYHPDTLPSDISEYDLAVYLDAEKIPTDINAMSSTATADVWHFSNATLSYPASNFVFPVNGLPGDTACPGTWYSVVWGGTYNDGCKGTGGHPGVDIRVPSGTLVKAIASGIVYKSYDSSTWGGLVVIKHEVKGISEPVWSVYAHLKRRDVKAGDPITVAGQKIGLSGGDKNDPNHGTSTGPHLHFQIDKGAVFLYPYWPATGTEVFDASLSANTYDPLKFIKASASPTCPNGNGLYCGDSSLGQNVNTLYDCQNGNYEEQEQCANGCQTMPSGTDDQCKDDVQPTSCPYGTGLYCGKSSLGQNTNYLYYCQDGSYEVREQCSNGCEVMPPDVDDKCKDGSAASITIINPTSSDDWRSDERKHIEWKSENLSSQKDVKIEYSMDGGNTWRTIEESTPNDGSRYWDMCNFYTANTDHAYIRVTSVNYPSVYDISDEFTIDHAAGCE